MVRPFVATRVVDGELDWVDLKPAECDRVRALCLPWPLYRVGEAGGDGTALTARLFARRGRDPKAAGRCDSVGRRLEAGRVTSLTGAWRGRAPAGGLRPAHRDRPTGLRDVDAACSSRLARRRGALAEPGRHRLARWRACCERQRQPGRTPSFARGRRPSGGRVPPAWPAGYRTGTHGVRARASASPSALLRRRHASCGGRCFAGWPGPGERPPAASYGGDPDGALRRSAARGGQVLRHRRLLTTAIYAKVDRAGLRLLARPWPGGAI